MSEIKEKLLLQSSPHIASPVNSSALMRNVLIALSPVAIFAVIIFGLQALLNIIVAVASAVAGEALFRFVTKQPIRAKDFSACVSGLILALTIPPTTPLWMTALGAVFAIVVGKEFFGGLGANVFNPALIGRAFLVTSFPASLTTWQVPILPAGSAFTADVVTGATPLGIIKMGGSVADVGNSLASAGLSADASYWQTIKTLFFGFNGGSMGETPVFLILAACFFLLVTKTIDWRAPVFMIGAGFIFALAFWQDFSFALFSILTGGLFFGAVFMVTDYVTSPVTNKGKMIFGAGVGLIAMLIRRFGIYPEGVCFAILIMNAAVPFLNKLLPKKYGHVQKKKEVAK
ncbi:MAG: RnfABCDGE type electron transport complex subunit D [Treponema sp.]|jgi:electron transport complex protein RnfD|nr:RnfABCDGE type electron transport complex subunit D [Treponema sp.]